MMQILKRFANALTMPVSIKTNNYFDELDANFTGTNYSEYFKISKKHALTGDCNAQNNLGFCYENGLGVKQDYYEAAKFYRLAAEQGLYIAINNIGFLYKNGLGVLQDFEEAFKCFKLAA